ncbi:uncharacterized protein B0T23DRAFT_372223 [Neurospora hispaniola]|uniref:Uncharacterized protein n=1 Tax=Neurospora hispaniola TaxID=588809 RepID=A0AAJ0MW73_9PEZI|nr:hypothetical protein B0T23DRAFT_372223 [Neurospora hispaniola]
MDDDHKMMRKSYVTNAKAFRTIALQRWPKPQTKNDSGLACLVAVVRHLLSCFPRQLRVEIAETAECSEALKGFLQSDTELSFKSLRRVFDQNNPMTFESLIEQPPMVSMLQDRPCFQFHCGEYATPNGGPREGQTQFLQVAATGMEWDGTGQQSLTEHIRQHEMYRKFLEIQTAVNSERAPSTPLMIRLKYTNKAHGRWFPSDLSSFSLRNSFPEDSAPSPNDIFRYYAVAVIKLRRSDNEDDSLRLYDEYGNPLEYSRRVDKTVAPWSEEWTIENEGEYVIYYIRNSSPVTPPSHPLVTVSPPQRTILLQKSRQAFEASKMGQNPPQLSSNETHSPPAQSQQQRDRQRAGILSNSTSRPVVSHSDQETAEDAKENDQRQVFTKNNEQEQTSSPKSVMSPPFSDSESDSDDDDEPHPQLDEKILFLLDDAMAKSTDTTRRTASNVEPRSRSSASHSVMPHLRNQVSNRDQVASSVRPEDPQKSQGVRHTRHQQAQRGGSLVGQKPPHPKAAAPSAFSRTQPEYHDRANSERRTDDRGIMQSPSRQFYPGRSRESSPTDQYLWKATR